MAFSALGGENLTVPGHLIGRGHLRLLKEDVFVSNSKAILAIWRGAVVAIEVCSGANVGYTMRQQAWLAIVAKQAIEGLEMRVDG
jgi:hypothetical protein